MLESFRNNLACVAAVIYDRGRIISLYSEYEFLALNLSRVDTQYFTVLEPLTRNLYIAWNISYVKSNPKSKKRYY